MYAMQKGLKRMDEILTDIIEGKGTKGALISLRNLPL